MDRAEAVETNAEILTAAERAAGFKPTKKQRDDWRRFGLIPGALDQHGAGKGRGSVAHYPAGTGALLAAVCRHAKPKKPLEDLALLVWWDGFAVPDPGLARAGLSRTLDRWEQKVAPWACPAERSPAEWRALERGLPPSIRTARAAVGAELFRWFLGELGRVAAGGFDGFRPSYPGDSIADVRGDAKRSLALGAVTWMRKDLETYLTDLSALIRPSALRGALDRAAAADLDRARDEARDAAALLGALAELGRREIEDGEFAPFALLTPPTSTALGVGMLALFWLAMGERPPLRRGFRLLAEATKRPIQ